MQENHLQTKIRGVLMSISKIKKSLSLLTAHYDNKTDSIHGCKKGGLVWFHEKRHQWQYNHPIIGFIIKAVYFIFIVFGSLILSLFIFCLLDGDVSFKFNTAAKAIGILITPHIILVWLLEIDAWIASIYWKLKGVKP